MKLKSRQNNNKKYIIIAVVAVVAIILAVVGIYLGLMTTVDPDFLEDDAKIQKIVISHAPKTEYYVGENFDPTDLKIQVVTNSQDKTYFVQYPNADIKISGFDSSVAKDEVPVTVTYKGFSVTFNVKVQEYPAAAPVLESIRLSDNFKTTYTLEKWNKNGPSFFGVKLILAYSDGTEQEVQMQSAYCYGIEDVAAPGTTEFTIKYSDGGIIVETTVEITVTN